LKNDSAFSVRLDKGRIFSNLEYSKRAMSNLFCQTFLLYFLASFSIFTSLLVFILSVQQVQPTYESGGMESNNSIAKIVDLLPVCSLYVSQNTSSPKLQRKSHLYDPRQGIARPQSQFPHSCVCDRFIYSQDRSMNFPAAE
jgi:hypothetical protein